MLHWLRNLFRTEPAFQPGDRVNLAPAGVVARTDGLVLSCNPHGVLVEWPRIGLSWEQPSTLSRIITWP